jgi:hypothetical protein
MRNFPGRFSQETLPRKLCPGVTRSWERSPRRKRFLGEKVPRRKRFLGENGS